MTVETIKKSVYKKKLAPKDMCYVITTVKDVITNKKYTNYIIVNNDHTDEEREELQKYLIKSIEEAFNIEINV